MQGAVHHNRNSNRRRMFAGAYGGLSGVTLARINHGPSRLHAWRTPGNGVGSDQARGEPPILRSSHADRYVTDSTDASSRARARHRRGRRCALFVRWRQCRPPIRGHVISATAFNGPATINADSRLVVYRMPAISGGWIDASTLVFVPRGAAPAGGWPIVGWMARRSLPNGAIG